MPQRKPSVTHQSPLSLLLEVNVGRLLDRNADSLNCASVESTRRRVFFAHGVAAVAAAYGAVGRASIAVIISAPVAEPTLTPSRVTVEQILILLIG